MESNRIDQSTPKVQVNPIRVIFRQAEQVVAQIKAGTQQSQLGFEALNNILITVQSKVSELENFIKASSDKNKELTDRINLNQHSLKSAELRIRELENLSETYKKNLQESLNENSRALEQAKSEACKNLMIKKTFENYVDYAAKSTADKIRDLEAESKKLNLDLNQKADQLKSALIQIAETNKRAQAIAKTEQDLQQQIKHLNSEKAISQRSFEQRFQAAEQSLLREKNLRKTAQDRTAQLELEIQELRQLNDALHRTLRLDQITVIENSETNPSTPAPKADSTPTHRIEETTDGTVLVWN
jgi:chromosome segregation ATPase